MDSELRNRLNRHRTDEPAETASSVQHLWNDDSSRHATRLGVRTSFKDTERRTPTPYHTPDSVVSCTVVPRNVPTSTAAVNTTLSLASAASANDIIGELIVLRQSKMELEKSVFERERHISKLDVELCLVKGQLSGRVRALNVLRETLLRDLIHANQQFLAERRHAQQSTAEGDFTYLDAFKLLETTVTADEDDDAARILQAIRTAMDAERFRSRALFEERIKSLELQVDRLEKDLIQSRKVEEQVQQSIADASDELRRRHAIEVADMRAVFDSDISTMTADYISKLDEKEEELAKANLNLREALRRGTLRRRDTRGLNGPSNSRSGFLSRSDLRQSVDLGASTAVLARSNTIAVPDAKRVESGSDESLPDLDEYDLDNSEALQASAQIQVLESKVTALETSIGEKDKDVTKLKNLVAQLTVDRSSVARKLTDAESSIERLRQDIVAANDETTQLRQQLAITTKARESAVLSASTAETRLAQLQIQTASSPLRSCSSLSQHSPIVDEMFNSTHDDQRVEELTAELEHLRSAHQSVTQQCRALEDREVSARNDVAEIQAQLVAINHCLVGIMDLDLSASLKCMESEAASADHVALRHLVSGIGALGALVQYVQRLTSPFPTKANMLSSFVNQCSGGVSNACSVLRDAITKSGSTSDRAMQAISIAIDAGREIIASTFDFTKFGGTAGSSPMVVASSDSEKSPSRSVAAKRKSSTGNRRKSVAILPSQSSFDAPSSSSTLIEGRGRTSPVAKQCDDAATQTTTENTESNAHVISIAEVHRKFPSLANLIGVTAALKQLSSVEIRSAIVAALDGAAPATVRAILSDLQNQSFFDGSMIELTKTPTLQDLSRTAKWLDETIRNLCDDLRQLPATIRDSGDRGASVAVGDRFHIVTTALFHRWTPDALAAEVSKCRGRVTRRVFGGPFKADHDPAHGEASEPEPTSVTHILNRATDIAEHLLFTAKGFYETVDAVDDALSGCLEPTQAQLQVRESIVDDLKRLIAGIECPETATRDVSAVNKSRAMSIGKLCTPQARSFGFASAASPPLVQRADMDARPERSSLGLVTLELDVQTKPPRPSSALSGGTRSSSTFVKATQLEPGIAAPTEVGSGHLWEKNDTALLEHKPVATMICGIPKTTDASMQNVFTGVRHSASSEIALQPALPRGFGALTCKVKLDGSRASSSRDHKIIASDRERSQRSPVVEARSAGATSTTPGVSRLVADHRVKTLLPAARGRSTQ